MAAILASEGYTREEKVLLIALLMHTTPAGIATASHGRLAAWTSMSERHVRRTIAALENLRVVTATRPSGHPGETLSYRLNLGVLAKTSVTVSEASDQARFDPGRSVHHRLEHSKNEASLALGSIRQRLAEIDAALTSDMQALGGPQRVTLLAEADGLRDLQAKYESFVTNYDIPPPPKPGPKKPTEPA